MTGESLNIKLDELEKLRKLFPGIFSEGVLDWEKLKATFGDSIHFNNERYVLNWAGKTEAYKALQTPTTATLKPCPEESIEFDTSQNIFIEGENLEVLKILQKSYFGKIKVICIDPPYNTGNDSFVYPDKFSEKKEEYLKRVGDKDEEGYLMKEGLFRKNSKDNGHFHSNWLSMMFPRLFLARNLLRDDGVIFVHIDDNEVHNLRLLMNEIFGEENFEGHIHWRRRHNQPNDKTKMIGIVAEHILAYSKNKEALKKAGVGTVDLTGSFSNSDNDPRGEWASKPWKAGSDQTGSRYTIKSPSGISFDEEWMGDSDSFDLLVKDNRIIFPKGGDGLPRKKYFRSEREEEGQSATNWWNHNEFGHNQGANDEMTKLFGVKNLFDNPKPKELIRGLLQVSNTQKNDIVLDFFAGSATVAQSVLELNEEDKGERKFILIQLPEPCKETEEAYKAGFKNIAEISKERIRRVIRKIESEKINQQDLFKEASGLPLGFRVFKLSTSNFKIWDSQSKSSTELISQLDAFTDPVSAASDNENMLYELLLKAGYSLTEEITKKNSYYAVKDNELIIILDAVNNDIITEILADNPLKIICLDRLFAGNDQLKTNTILQLKEAGIDFKII